MRIGEDGRATDGFVWSWESSQMGYREDGRKNCKDDNRLFTVIEIVFDFSLHLIHVLFHINLFRIVLLQTVRE